MSTAAERPIVRDDEPAEARRAAGRPRSAEVDRAIGEAALALLVDEGYGGMSVEGIANRAGVGKAAIYRRWSTKAEVVVDALQCHAYAHIPLPDTGDVRADLLEVLTAQQQAFSGADGPLMAALAAEKSRHPELRAAFERAFVRDRRAHLHRLFASAVERGDLPPDTDVELLVEAAPSILVHRVTIHAEAPTPDLPQRIVDLLLGPAPTGR